MVKSYRIALWSALIAFGGLFFALQALSLQNSEDRPQAVVLTLNGVVSPPAADYLTREIKAASDANAELIILELDTPGGLVTSMKSIIKAILASDTPVATYVSPQGAQSASAGLYIMYSAHVSAMAPATNTGAATPVQLGGGSPAPDDEPVRPRKAPEIPPSENTSSDDFSSDKSSDTSELEDAAAPLETPQQTTPIRQTPPLSNDAAMRAKVINDSVAYIRSLAELRGRNAQWAERAVREAVSVPASEALSLGVIDLIANDMDSLLQQIDGRTVSVASGEKTIDTEGMILTRIAPTFAEKILGFFADPNVAAILMSIGTLGITIELWNPGSLLPGFVGVTSLALGLYSLQVLPFTWLGVGLVLIGILGIILEAYTPTLGLIGLAGLACFAIGLMFLFPEEFRVSNTVILSSVAMLGGILAIVLFALVGSRSHGPLIGEDAIKRREGIVDEWDGSEGFVIVEGERWRARSNQPLEPGDRIKVTQIDGLVLIVRKAKADHGLLAAIKPGQAT